jgi:hypothetical protein
MNKDFRYSSYLHGEVRSFRFGEPVVSYQPFSPFSPLSYCTKATENVIPELIFLDKLLHF